MGSPDPMQIDGLGGTHIVTSKIAIVSPSKLPEVDVEYTFPQVGVKEGIIGYDGNCGNISSAVGPFAIREGLLKDEREGKGVGNTMKMREVRVLNTEHGFPQSCSCG